MYGVLDDMMSLIKVFRILRQGALAQGNSTSEISVLDFPDASKTKNEAIWKGEIPAVTCKTWCKS
jgi:hypothetical protein